MSFIAKNPISAAEITSLPPVPIKGTRGIFAKEDGWYEIDDEGNVSKLGSGGSDVPLESGEGINSIQIIGVSKAISDYAIALGDACVAGLKGYYIKSIDIENKKIYLTDTKITPVISTEDNTDLSFETPAYDIGDIFSLILKPFESKRNHYHYIASIVSILNNVVEYDVELPFTELYPDDSEPFSPTLSVATKPEVGIINISSNSVVAGLMSTAAGEASFVTGENNIGAGKYCFVFGADNVAAYAALAGGAGNLVLGNYGVGLGTKTIVRADRGIAAGHYCEANAENGTALGESTKANGKNSLVGGKLSSASGENSLAFGLTANAGGDTALALGQNTFANAALSIAFGMHSKTLPEASYGVAGGYRAEARAPYSIAYGYRAIAASEYQLVLGRDNIIDSAGVYRVIVGNGTNETKPSNAFTLGKNGDGWFAGEVYIGQGNGTKTRVLSETEVDSRIDSVHLRVDALEIEYPEHNDVKVADIEIRHNEMVYYGLVSDSLSVSDTNQQSLRAGFSSALYFTTPNSIPNNYTTFPDYFYFKGDSTDEGAFVPEANMRYTIVFDFDGYMINAYVSGVSTI